jgi:hypothetical protein
VTYNAVPESVFATFFPGAAEFADMFGWFNEYGYYGERNDQQKQKDIPFLFLSFVCFVFLFFSFLSCFVFFVFSFSFRLVFSCGLMEKRYVEGKGSVPWNKDHGPMVSGHKIQALIW